MRKFNRKNYEIRDIEISKNFIINHIGSRTPREPASQPARTTQKWYNIKACRPRASQPAGTTRKLYNITYRRPREPASQPDGQHKAQNMFVKCKSSARQ